MQSNLVRAVIIILFGIVAFDMMAVMVRMLGSEYSILQISVLRNIFGIIPALILVIIGPGLSSLCSVSSISIIYNHDPEYRGSGCAV